MITIQPGVLLSEICDVNCQIFVCFAKKLFLNLGNCDVLGRVHCMTNTQISNLLETEQVVFALLCVHFTAIVLYIKIWSMRGTVVTFSFKLFQNWVRETGCQCYRRRQRSRRRRWHICRWRYTCSSKWLRGGKLAMGRPIKYLCLHPLSSFSSLQRLPFYLKFSVISLGEGV